MNKSRRDQQQRIVLLGALAVLASTASAVIAAQNPHGTWAVTALVVLMLGALVLLGCLGLELSRRSRTARR